MANLKAVLSRPNVSSNYSRNVFDRSESHKLTYDLGVLTPFFCQPFIAGSHVKLNRAIFQRTKAVNTAAFPTVDTHCEFFCVPLRLLWSYWNNFKLNIQDYNSSSFGVFDGTTFVPNAPQTIPTFNLGLLRYELKDIQSSGSIPSGSTIITSVAQGYDALRLLDLLGYGSTYRNQTGLTDQDNFLANPFPLLAYQKIYFDHFRNTAYESNVPVYYNVDRFTTSSSNSLNAAEVARILTLRSVNYRRDYFKSVYPALNYVSSAPTGHSWSLPDSVSYKMSAGSSTRISSIVNNSASGGQTSLGFPIGSTSEFSFGTVQQIRAAFALDKLLRASAYAPKHVKDQFEARYGVKNIESGNESVRIGAFMNDIIFQEVTATASTTDSRLGEIGAKGVGHNAYGDDIDFTCKEDCIIMGLCYSLPRSAYDGTMIRNWNMKMNREDFFIPEFMNLGLQPLYQIELSAPDNRPALQNSILGYVPRYQEYKVGFDVNHINFRFGDPLSDFTNHTSQTVGIGSNGVNVPYFKVQRTDLDSVFVQQTLSDFDTDSFISYIQVKCICNQNMSVHGQPVLGSM